MRPLLHENKVKENKQEFLAEVRKVAKALGVDPNALMAIMNRESGLNHRAENKSYRFSDGGFATGLIQFVPSTARTLGTTTQALKNMSNVQQLAYVYRFYEPFKEMLGAKTLLDQYLKLYLITFYPNPGGEKGGILKKPDTYVFPRSVLKANPKLDMDRDGILTLKDVKNHMIEGIPDDWKKRFKRPTPKALWFGIGLVVVAIFVGWVLIKRGAKT